MENQIKKISPTEFVEKIKNKYPQYNDVEDTVLLDKMIEKYPQYKDQINFETPSEPKEVQAEVDNGDSQSPSANQNSSLGLDQETNIEKQRLELESLEDKGLGLREKAIKNITSKYENEGIREYQVSDDEITKEAYNIKHEKKSLWEDTKNLFNIGVNKTEAALRNGLFGSAKTAFLYTAPKEVVDRYNNLEQLLDDDVDITTAKDEFISDFYRTKLEPVGDMLEWLSSTSDVFRKQAKEIEKEVTEYDTAIFEDLSKGDVGQATRRIFSEGVGSLPSMVQWLTPYTTAIGAQGLYAENIRELEESGEKLEDKTLLNSAVKAGAEVMLEKFTAKLANKFVKTAVSQGVPKKKILDSAIDVLVDANKEGLSEAATTAIQDASDVLIQGKEGDLSETLKKSLDSYLVGFGVGQMMSGSTESINMVSRTKGLIGERRAINLIQGELNKDNSYESVTDVYKSPKLDLSSLKIATLNKSGDIIDAELNIKTNSGEISADQAVEIKKNYLQTTKILKQTQIKGLSDEKRLNVAKLVQEKQSLEKEIEGLDSAIATPIKEKIKQKEIDIQDEINRKEITPYTSEDTQVTNDSEKYSKAQNKAFDSRKDGGIQADRITPEYAQQIVDEGGKIVMTKDGKAGGYVKSDGYIGGVFKDPFSQHSGASKVLQEARIKEGGKFTEALGENLEKHYIKNGFRPVARVPFNEDIAPEGWKDNKHLKSKPDNVFMVYDPEGVYKKGDGELIEDYNQAYNTARDFEVQETSVKDIEKIDLSDSLGINKVIEILDKADVKLSKHAKETLGMNLPVAIAQGTIKAMKAAAKTSKLAADISSAGMNHIMSTQWYQGLKKSEKDTLHKKGALNIISEMENELRKSESPKTSVIKKVIRKNTGQVDNSKKIKISEKSLLKEKFKNLQKGYKTGVKETRQLKADFIKQAVKDLQGLRNDIPSKTFTRLMSLVNQVSDKNLDKVNEALDFIVEKAYNRDTKVTINSKKKKLSTKINSKSSAVNQSLKDLSKTLKSINISKVLDSDLDRLNDLYDDVLAAYLSFNSDKYKTIDISKATEEVLDINNNIEQSYFDELQESGEELSKLGEDLYKQDEEFKKIVEGLDKQRREKLKQELINKAISVRAKVKSIDPKFKHLLSVDLNKFGESFIKEYGKVLDNYVTNGSEIGLGKLSNTALADIRSDKINSSELSPKARKKKDAAVVDSFRELSEFFRYTFGTTKRAGLFNRLIGLDQLGQQEVLRSDKMKSFEEEYSNLIYKLSKKNPSLLTPKGNIKRAVISNLIQGDTKEDFEINKSRLEQELEYLSEYESEKKKYNFVKEVYDQYSKLDSQENILDTLNKENDGNYEIIKYTLNAFSETEPELRKVAERTHGVRMAEKVENYIPLSTMVNKDGKTVEDEPTEGSYFNSNDGFTVDPVKNVIARNKSPKLPKNRRLNLDFDRSIKRSMDKVLSDIYLSDAAQLIKSTSNAINRKEIFSVNKEIRDIIQDRVNKAVSIYLNTQSTYKKVHPVVKKIDNIVNNIGVRTALGGITAGVKQSIPVLAGALPRLGYNNIGLLFEGMRDLKNGDIELLNKYAVSQRAESKGGTTLSGNRPDKVNVSKLSDSGKITRLAIQAVKLSEKADQAVMWSLTKGDSIVAKSTWIAYYKKYLKEKGETDIDMKTEHLKIDDSKVRQDAASYAEAMIETTQVASDKARGSDLFRSDGSMSSKVLRNMLFAFQRFNVASKVRLYDDVALMMRAKKNGDKESLNEASRDFMATLTEQVVFTSLKIYALKPLTGLVSEAARSLFDLEEPKEDEDQKDAFRFKQWYSELVKNTVPFTAGSFLENGSLETLNYITWYHTADEDESFFEWEKKKMQDGSLPFYYYGNKAGVTTKLLESGIYGIAPELVGELNKDVSFSLNPEGKYENSYGGMTKYDLNSDQHTYMKWMTLIDLMTLTLAFDADTRRELKKVQREQFKKKKEIKSKNIDDVLKRLYP